MLCFKDTKHRRCNASFLLLSVAVAMLLVRRSAALTIPRLLHCPTSRQCCGLAVVAPLFSSRTQQDEPFGFWETLDCDTRDNKPNPIQTGRIREIARAIDKSDVTDLIVISHGWRNTYEEAEESYKKLASNIVSALKDGESPEEGVKLGLIGIPWPSLIGDKRNPDTFERLPDDRE